jgi:hypothetical protein
MHDKWDIIIRRYTSIMLSMINRVWVKQKVLNIKSTVKIYVAKKKKKEKKKRS